MSKELHYWPKKQPLAKIDWLNVVLRPTRVYTFTHIEKLPLPMIGCKIYSYTFKKYIFSLREDWHSLSCHWMSCLNFTFWQLSFLWLFTWTNFIFLAFSVDALCRVWLVKSKVKSLMYFYYNLQLEMSGGFASNKIKCSRKKIYYQPQAMDKVW